MNFFEGIEVVFGTLQASAEVNLITDSHEIGYEKVASSQLLYTVLCDWIFFS